jgi:hypothetical protein
MTPNQKLYKVTLKGMTYSSTGPARGISYVVATDPTEAYERLRLFLDKEKYGYERERELHTIELMAEAFNYTNCGHILFL